MNEIKISHTGIDQCLKRCQCNTLEYPCPYETIVVLTANPSPDTADNHQDMPDQEQMTFTPDSSGWHNENTRHTDTAQVISSQQGSCCKRNFLIVRDGDRICGQNGA